MINLNDDARCYVSMEFAVSFLSKIECVVGDQSEAKTTLKNLLTNGLMRQEVFKIRLDDMSRRH